MHKYQQIDLVYLCSKQETQYEGMMMFCMSSRATTLFVCVSTSVVFVQDFVSRPSSQMSHAASSGYGSARSTNRTVAEVVNPSDGQTGSTLCPPGRSRNSLVNSLRKPKVADSSLLFRSLRVPRAEPPYAAPGSVRDDPVVACQPSENDIVTVALPLQTVLPNDQEQDSSHDQLHSIPVPAPRFHTLKRHGHAYQNIPLPLKKSQTQDYPQSQEEQDPFVQVIFIDLTHSFRQIFLTLSLSRTLA